MLDSIHNILANLMVMAIECASELPMAMVRPFLTFASDDIMLTIINMVYESLIILGVGMLIFYFLLDLNKSIFMNGSNVTFQTMITPMLKLGAGYIIIVNGGTLIGYFLSFCNWWTDFCSNTTIDAGADSSATFQAEMVSSVREMIDGMGLVPSIIAFLPIVILFILQLVVAVIFMYKAISWKLELSLRIAMAPISFGDIYDGKNSNMLRYLKKILSAVLYAGIMLLVIRFGTVLYVNMFQDISNSLAGITASILGMTTEEYLAISEGGGFGAGVLAYVQNTSLGQLVGIIAFIPMTLASIVIPIVELGAIKIGKQICDDVLA